MGRDKTGGNKSFSKSLASGKSAVKSKKKSARISNWESIEGFFIRHDKKILILLVLLFAFFGLALFDVLVSVAGDDATYIERAYNLVHFGEITFYQGPLYPAILGIGVAIFGINLVALKSMSFLFMLGQEILFYFTFKKRIPFVLLFTVMFLIATNLFIQYYSSQTYTEAAFMFLQALSLFVVFKLIDVETTETRWLENAGNVVAVRSPHLAAFTLQEHRYRMLFTAHHLLPSSKKMEICCKSICIFSILESRL